MAALSSLPVRGLVTLGPTIAAALVPGTANVRVVQAAPHAQVLPKAAVVVTHCGHGTTHKALGAGVPLVCMPMGRDQNDTAARVVHHGAGVRISPAGSERSIRRAVVQVLEQPAYAEAARRLAHAIQSRDGCVDPIAELEALRR